MSQSYATRSALLVCSGTMGNLTDLLTHCGDGIVALSLTQPMTSVLSTHLFVAVKDQQGNVTRVNQAFSVDAGGNSTPKTFLPVIRRH